MLLLKHRQRSRDSLPPLIKAADKQCSGVVERQQEKAALVKSSRDRHGGGADNCGASVNLSCLPNLRTQKGMLVVRVPFFSDQQNSCALGFAMERLG
jgi:hypothetical protein